jgi:hypothetical protein
MDDRIREALSVLVGRMVIETPELTMILRRSKNGKITETEAMQQMVQYLVDHPGTETALAQIAHDTLRPLGEPGAGPPIVVDSQGESMFPGLIFKPEDGGLPRLNPLMEAALIERLQFDGDIPEMRTGPMPLGVTPAVPVKTEAKSSVAIGRMLGTAARKVRSRLDAHHAERARLVEAVAAGDPAALAVVAKHGELVAQGGDDGLPDLAVIAHGSKETDLAVYRRGEVPAPLAVATPTGAELASMTKEERQEAAYKFFSTTQGRLSAVPLVRGMVAKMLRAKGIEVRERDFDKTDKREAVIYGEWQVMIGGSGATQTAFAVVDVAVRVISVKLMKGFEAHPEHPKKVILEVVPVSLLSDRVVGWDARLLPK